MRNPILGTLNANQAMPQNLSQIKQMFNMVRGSGNPQMMLDSMMQSNPQMKQVTDVINQSGGDPRKAFYAMAEQKGVDPNQILNMLK